MGTQNDDALRHVAEQVADCLSEGGVAFVEDDKLDTLAVALQSFLTAAEIPVHPMSFASGTRAAIGDPIIPTSSSYPRAASTYQSSPTKPAR
jgi:hypothetical protein